MFFKMIFLKSKYFMICINYLLRVLYIRLYFFLLKFICCIMVGFMFWNMNIIISIWFGNFFYMKNKLIKNVYVVIFNLIIL